MYALHLGQYCRKKNSFANLYDSIICSLQNSCWCMLHVVTYKTVVDLFCKNGFSEEYICIESEA